VTPEGSSKPCQSSVQSSEGRPSEASGLGDSAENYAILDEVLRDSCLELMAEYGLPATLQADLAASQPPCAVAIAAIDFIGPDVRGTISLRMTPSVVIETYRTALGAVTQADSSEAADWTCELVNQLIGRLKNKLRNYQVSFSVSTPRLAPKLAAAEPERVLRRRFVCHVGKFAGYLDVVIAPGVAFLPIEPEEPLAVEGDLVLF
jgi:chemotaxis protein CheX